MNNQFEDKVVYITGAANGIGKSAADVFSDEGMATSTILFIFSLIGGGIGGYMIHKEFKDRTHMKIQEYYEYFSLIYPFGLAFALIITIINDKK